MGGQHHNEWIPLSAWAKMRGIHVRTAQRMFHRGEIDHPVRTTERGRLQVRVSLEEAKKARQGGNKSDTRRIETMLTEISARLARVEEALGLD